MPATQKSALRTRRQDRARQARQDATARKACVDKVWARDGAESTFYGWWARCAECQHQIYRVGNLFREVGHVHEKRARSLGGNPHNPDECELLCHACHFPGPSGAHRRSKRASA